MTKCRIIIDGVSPRSAGISKSDLKKAAEYFAERSSARIKTPFREVSIILQDDVTSDEAHRSIMDVAGATDVITQRYDAMPGEDEGVYGELYVNVERAVSYCASGKNRNPAKELLLYVAHGMDHLSGADDHGDRDRLRMRRRELKWIREIRYSLTALQGVFA